MQTRSETTMSVSDNKLTDALIGAAAGAVGVWVLDRLDWFFWSRETPETRRQTTAVRPGGEPPAHVVATQLERLVGADTSQSAEVADKIEHLDTEGLRGDRHYVAGAIVHYGIGIGPAALYSIIQDKLPLPGPARGALYGLTLFITQDEGMNALTGLGAKPRQYPWQAHARGLITHLAYGIVTDGAISMMKKQARSGSDRPRSATGGRTMRTNHEQSSLRHAAAGRTGSSTSGAAASIH